MSSIDPIEYHCKRHHPKEKIKTKAPIGQLHDLPKKCGYWKCRSPYFESLPKVCFQPGYDPFDPKNTEFLDEEGGVCRECIIEWAMIKKCSREEAEKIYEQRSIEILLAKTK